MNTARKLLGFLLLAFALAGFSSTSMAQSKIFGVTMSFLGTQTITGPAGQTTGPTFRAVYTNLTPNGNSTINSVILTGPVGITITNAQLQSTYTQNNTAIVMGPANTVSVSNMIGIKSGGNLNAYVDVQVSGAPVCSTWSPQAFAGNAFSQPFALQTSQSVLTVGSGSGCQFSLNLSPSPVNQNSTGVSMTATFSNNGGAYSSFSLAPPTGIGLTIASLPTLTLPSGTTASVSWCSNAGGSVCVTSVSPAVPANTTVAVNLKVNVAPTCTTTLTGNWGATAYGGATLNGTAFSVNPTSSQLATAITAQACGLAFPPPPTNPTSAAVTVPFTLYVQETGGSGTAAVTLTSDAPGFAPVTVNAVAGLATFPNLTIGTVGTWTFTATSSALGNATTSLSSFPVYKGVLYCGDALDPLQTNPGGGTFGTPGYAEGRRSGNKDGSGCVKVDYTFTNDILGSNQVSLVWDKNLQPNAAFTYTMTWKDSPVDPATGFPQYTVKVAWEIVGGYPKYVPGLACLSNQLPAAYTALAATINATTTSITVNAPSGTLPAVPFPIVIDSERMSVTSTGAGTDWTVVRGDGMTTPATHNANAPVMSTPLPVNYVPLAYYYGKQMHMCVWDQQWQSIGNGMVRTTTSVFDIGDGFVTND